MSEDCPHCVYEKNEANCRGCFEGSNYRPKPATNAERIRAMTDEELAEFLGENDSNFPIGDHKKKWLNWLKQEASDDNDDH